MNTVYCLKRTQKLPVSLPVAWDFFSDPANLHRLTPDYLHLKFTNELFGDAMYPGQIITYHVKPVLGIPLFWMTEITHVQHHCYFIDEQRKGPYNLWHHQHHFGEMPGGVLMTDIVHYALPAAILGRLAHRLWVRRQLENIFDYRVQKVEEMWRMADV